MPHAHTPNKARSRNDLRLKNGETLNLRRRTRSPELGGEWNQPVAVIQGCSTGTCTPQCDVVVSFGEDIETGGLQVLRTVLNSGFQLMPTVGATFLHLCQHKGSTRATVPATPSLPDVLQLMDLIQGRGSMPVQRNARGLVHKPVDHHTRSRRVLPKRRHRIPG